MSETGGFVLTATWPDGYQWLGRIGAIRGRVTEERTRNPVLGAEVSLGESGSTWTDDSGYYTLTPIPPGRYEIRIIDSTWTYFIPRYMKSREIDVARDTVIADFEVPQHGAGLGEMCRKQRRRTHPIWLGMVTDGTGDRPHDMDLRIASTDGAMTVPIDQTGHFLLCGAPNDGQMGLSVLYKGIAIADTSFALPPSPAVVRVLPWSIGRSVFGPARRGDQGVLVGHLISDGLPASGVAVKLPASGDTATTAADGSFRFVGLKAQPYEVALLRPGGWLVADTVTIRKHEETSWRFVFPSTRGKP